MCVQVQPTHLRLLLLDTVYAILPSASERGDTNLLWEALACGAIPVLSGDRNAIADELLKAQGLPPSPIPLLDTDFESMLAQSSQRYVNLPSSHRTGVLVESLPQASSLAELLTRVTVSDSTGNGVTWAFKSVLRSGSCSRIAQKSNDGYRIKLQCFSMWTHKKI